MSRIASLFSLALVTVVGSAFADSPLSQTPASSSPAPDVYLTPFHLIAGDADWAWTGQAVEQSLQVDLTRAAHTPAVGDPADPLAAARSAGARYLVTGTYQWADPQLRFTGQLTDAATGSVVAGLSATRDAHALFALEDDLSAQILHALPRTANRRPSTTRPVPASLQPDALAAVIAPPAAGTGSAYAGSALQAYVNANLTTSVGYDQQITNVRDANTFGTYNNYGGPDGQGYVGGFDAYGYGGGYLPGVSYPVAAGAYGAGYIGYAGYGGSGHAGGIGRGADVGFGGRGGIGGFRGGR
jgi:TolB-like protein